MVEWFAICNIVFNLDFKNIFVILWMNQTIIAPLTRLTSCIVALRNRLNKFKKGSTCRGFSVWHYEERASFRLPPNRIGGQIPKKANSIMVRRRFKPHARRTDQGAGSFFWPISECRPHPSAASAQHFRTYIYALSLHFKFRFGSPTVPIY